MSSSISEPAYISLFIEGIYLHDPDDPSGTLVNFRYGKAKRSTSIDVASTQLVFAGRRFPVVEFSDNQQDSFSVTIDIPNDENYYNTLQQARAFAETRQTLVFRDIRGRSAHGVLSGYREDDQDYGVSVSFTFQRVDYADESTLVEVV